MTDEQKALEWVDADIEASEGMGDGDITQGGRKVYPLEILRTLRSALEPKVMNMAWVKKWDSEFLYDLVHRNGMTMHTWKAMLNELGIAVKGE